MVSKNIKVLLVIFIITLILILGVYLFNFTDVFKSKENFTTNPIFFKLNIPINGEVTNNIKITNEQNAEQTFKLSFIDLESIASLGQTEFSISSQESESVKILFKDSLGFIDAYVGGLIVESSKDKKIIPIILNIQNQYNNFAITQKITLEYDSINPGGKLFMDIRILNIKDDKLHNLKINYQIRNLKNEVIISEDESISIKDSVTTTKTFDIPEDIDCGDYVFITFVTENSPEVVATSLFEIEKKKFSLEGDNYLIFIMLVFITGVFAMFFYFVKSKDETVPQLKQQQKKELIGNLKIVNRYEKELNEEKNKILNKKKEELKKIKNRIKEEVEKERELQNLRKYKEKNQIHRRIEKEKRKQELKKSEEEKKRIAEEFDKKIKHLKKEKSNVVYKIKEKQKKQTKEVKILKKKGKKKEIKEKLKNWGKEAVKMTELQKEIKVIPKEKINKDLERRKEELKKEFMGKYYSGLGKKNIRMK